jgi:hypothetical protein
MKFLARCFEIWKLQAVQKRVFATRADVCSMLAAEDVPAAVEACVTGLSNGVAKKENHLPKKINLFRAANITR